MSLYNDLGVGKNASADEIKKAYKLKANKHHPDKPTGNAEKFHVVALAYSVLSDPKRRDEYDKTGSTEKRKGPEASAEQVIYMWLNEILEQDSMLGDIVLELTNRIDSGRAQLKKALNQAKFRKKKFEKLLGRVSGGKPEDNLVDNALNKKISDCQNQIDNIEEQFKASDCMEAMLNGYEDNDKTEPKHDLGSILYGRPESSRAFDRMSSSHFRKSGLWK